MSGKTIKPAQSVSAEIDGGTLDTLTSITNRVDVSSFLIEVAKGNVAGHSLITKFGENPDIDILSPPESIWDGSGLYTWLPDIGGENLEVLSTSTNDTGVVLSTGTVDSGSVVTLVDGDATFSSDGVAVGDLVINDTNDQFGIINSVSETILVCAAMNNGSQENFTSTANTAGDTYRIATANGTGLGAGVLNGIDATGLFVSEVYVLNGLTEVALKRPYMGTHRMSGIIGGTIAGNIGDIICQTVADETITAQMVAGNNKTLMAVFRTPSDKISYFMKGYVTISKTGNPAATNTARFTWRVTPYGSVTSVNGVAELISTGSSSWQYDYKAIPGIPPLTLVDIRCDAVSHDNTGVVGGMDILMVDIGS